MERPPKGFIARVFEFAVLFALTMFLFRLGVYFVIKVWPALLILAVVIIIAVIGYRIWKNKARW